MTLSELFFDKHNFDLARFIFAVVKCIALRHSPVVPCVSSRFSSLLTLTRTSQCPASISSSPPLFLRIFLPARFFFSLALQQQHSSNTNRDDRSGRQKWQRARGKVRVTIDEVAYHLPFTFTPLFLLPFCVEFHFTASVIFVFILMRFILFLTKIEYLSSLPLLCDRALAQFPSNF